MTTLTQRTSFDPGPTLSVMPEAGRPVTGGDAFNQVIRAAVDTVDPNTLHAVAPSNAGPAFQPQELLASIIDCYARQIYSSTEIEVRLASNTDTRPFGLTAWPDAHLIKEFRRDNRTPIQLGLMHALWLLGQQKVQAGTVTRVNPASLAEEACRRVIMALFTDSMESGEG